MKIPPGATSRTPPAGPLHGGVFNGATLRHTFRPRGGKDWLLIYTRAGSGLYRFSGGEFRSRPHDVTLYRPGEFQDYQIAPGAKKWEITFAHFMPREEWLPWLEWPGLGPGLMLLSLREPALRRRVERGLREMARLRDGLLARPVAFAQNALERVLLGCDTVNPRHREAQLDPRVRRAADYLSAHGAEPFSAETLSRVAALSPSRLRHLFQAQTGRSPRGYLEELRLRRARDLLAFSRQTVREIAEELGFSHAFYFTLRFKKQMGESPRAFRRRVLRA